MKTAYREEIIGVRFPAGTFGTRLGASYEEYDVSPALAEHERMYDRNTLIRVVPPSFRSLFAGMEGFFCSIGNGFLSNKSPVNCVPCEEKMIALQYRRGAKNPQSVFVIVYEKKHKKESQLWQRTKN